MHSCTPAVENASQLDMLSIGQWGSNLSLGVDPTDDEIDMDGNQTAARC